MILSIITGSMGSLGSSICKKIYNRNHFIIGITTNKDISFDGNIHYISQDLSKIIDIYYLKEKIDYLIADRNFEQINIIHTAGKYKKSELLNPENNILFYNNFNIHVMSLLSIVQATKSYFEVINNGNIIAISSSLIQKQNHDTGPYIVTKGALECLIKNLAYELGKYKIKCNCIAPSYFDSNISNMLYDKNEKKILHQKITNNSPLKELVTVEEIANLVVFLLKSNISMTGQIIHLDGGNNLGYN